MKRIILFILITLITIVILMGFLLEKKDKEIYEPSIEENENISDEYVLKEINIIDVDGREVNYEFKYNNEVFKVEYLPDHWKIYNSYKINIRVDMENICEKLININPIHGKDMISYRTSEDMVYEWMQHNIAYYILPNDNIWKDNAKDVDFDPYDQGMSIAEIYEDRTGEKFNFSNILN